MDRFTRSAVRGLADLEALEDSGKTIVFVKEAIDTATPTGRLFRTLMAAFAEFERETIRERNMGGRYAKAQHGGWANGPTPFGYYWDADEMRLREEKTEAAMVRRAFELRLSGLSVYKTAKRLVFEGHRLRNPEVDVGQSQIARWLRQTHYRGDPYVVHLRPSATAAPVRFEYEADALISPEDWLAAQRTSTRNQGRTHPYALLGRVFHEHEDGPAKAYGARYQNGSRRYRCADSHKGACEGMGIVGGKRQTSISAERLETAALLWLLDYMEAAEASEWLGDASKGHLGHWDTQDTPQDLTEALSGLSAKRDRWLETYAEGLISKPERDARLEALADEEADLEARLRATLAPALTEADPKQRPPRGGAPWTAALHEAAQESPLPQWAIDELTQIAQDTDLTALITYGPDITFTVN